MTKSVCTNPNCIGGWWIKGVWTNCSCPSRSLTIEQIVKQSMDRLKAEVK